MLRSGRSLCFFFQAEDGIRDLTVTGVQTCALPIWFSDDLCAVGMVAMAAPRCRSRLVSPRTSSPNTSAHVPGCERSRAAVCSGVRAPGTVRPVVITTSRQSPSASSSVRTTRMRSRICSAPAASFAACARSNPRGSTTQSAPAPVFASARAAAPMFCELRGRLRTNRSSTCAILPRPGGGAMDEILKAQLPYTLRQADFPALGELYRGKVRDNYAKGDRIVMITTDRLSAFDRVLTTIPFKGEILNRLTVFWFEKTKDVAPNHILDVPDPSVLVVRRLQPLAVEMVVRGYLTGSLWRDYQAGKGAKAYGIDLPKQMRKDERFEKPILTPSTKEQVGKHDEPVSPEELVARGTITRKQWDEMARISLDLFAAGQAWAKQRGLILVDTKYEFGVDGAGKLWVIDEIHTADSSRYWIAEGSEERARRGEEQKMLDKELFRQWLIRERNYKGEGAIPEIPDGVRVQLAGKELELVETLTGEAAGPGAGDTREPSDEAVYARQY